MFYRIAVFCLFYTSLFGIEQINLVTPNISEQSMIGTNVGIRPFRKSGVRLEAQKIDDKLVIHNYGYGGSGLTLSFGGAKEVLDLLSEHKIISKVVAVLGGGVIGLATAYDLLEKGYEVHLYAEQWYPELTSCVAAGIWTPLDYPESISAENKILHKRMLDEAELRFLKSANTDPEFAGVRLIKYYRLVEANQKARGDEVSIHFDNGLIKNAFCTTRLGIDGKVFMEDLYTKIKAKGAIMEQKRFDAVEDVLKLSEPIVVNCMSIGAAKIFADDEFVPVRGQIVYCETQEGVDYVLSQALTNENYFFAIYPWSDRIVVGGVFEVGEENKITTPDVIYTLIENAKNCLTVTLEEN